MLPVPACATTCQGCNNYTLLGYELSIYVSTEVLRVTRHLWTTATPRGPQAASSAELLLDRGARIDRHRHPISEAS